MKVLMLFGAVILFVIVMFFVLRAQGAPAAAEMAAPAPARAPTEIRPLRRSDIALGVFYGLGLFTLCAAAIGGIVWAISQANLSAAP